MISTGGVREFVLYTGDGQWLEEFQGAVSAAVETHEIQMMARRDPGMARVPGVRQDLSRTTCASVGSAQQNQLSLRWGRSSRLWVTSTGGAPAAARTRGVGRGRGLAGVGAGFHDGGDLLLERVDRGVGRLATCR